MMNAQNQLNDAAINVEIPFARNGINSPIINHGIGPKPNEKKMMNTITETIGIQP